MSESNEATEVSCECGQWSGERCEWSGPASATVVVEFMPDDLRASHQSAGNRGTFPHNGACRVRVERSCAQRMVDSDGAWCHLVESS